MFFFSEDCAFNCSNLLFTFSVHFLAPFFKVHRLEHLTPYAKLLSADVSDEDESAVSLVRQTLNHLSQVLNAGTATTR
jgi:hypothetical protein